MIKEVLSKYKNSKEAKVLAGNFLSLSILQLVGYIFPFITLPYLARVLGVDKFGILAFAFAVMAYLQAFVDFGFNYTAVRDIAQQKGNIKAVSKIFSTVMTIRVIFAGISLLILLVLILTVPLFLSNKTILLLTFTYIPCSILFPDWFFQAMEKMKFITILNVLSKLLFTILVFIVIKTKEDYIWQPVLSSMGILVSGILSLYIITNKFKIKYYLPTLKEVTYTIKKGWDMFLNIFLPNLYTNFSIILLRAYGGEVGTGIFNAGDKFIGVAQQITGVLSRTFYPFLARRIDKHSFYQKLSLTVSILMSLALFFGATLIVKIFYTSEFKDAATVMRILSLSIVPLFLMNAFGTNYLVLINHEKTLKKIILWCSIFGLVFSWFAIFYFNFIGTAITYLLVRGVMGILIWRFAVKYKKGLGDNVNVASDDKLH